MVLTISLLGNGECISCHQEESTNMTSDCNTCHTDTLQHQKNNLHKTSLQAPDDQSIIFSYQGLLQKEYGSKEFFQMHGDIHFDKGMECKSCHSSSELHNDDFYSAKTQSEVRCQDCHGTLAEYPWELPLKDQQIPRTISSEHNQTHLFNSKGKTLVNVVQNGKEVVVSIASGKELRLKPLKLLKKNHLLSKNAMTAMENIDAHKENLTCSSCHALWAPQYFGSSTVIDERIKNSAKQITKNSVFTRWEEPFLAQNRDGKIVPAVPKTPLKEVRIDKDGELSKKENGNLLKAVFPHTIQKQARSCESCHSSFKVLDGSVGAGVFRDTNISHFNVSKVLSSVQLDKLDRRGVCLSCHETIPNGNLAVSTISHMTQMLNVEADENKHAAVLERILQMSAWFGVILLVLVIVMLIYGIYMLFVKKNQYTQEIEVGNDQRDRFSLIKRKTQR